MNAAGVKRAIERQGETVTLRRTSGATAHRTFFDATIRAFVASGASSVLVGSVQQVADKVLFCSEGLRAARWPLPPRHGDLIFYEDGITIVTIQGRALTWTLDEDTVYSVNAIG